MVTYETISMGHETSYYSEPENKIEEERRLKILNEGVEQLKVAGIEAAGKLLKGDAVDKIVEYAQRMYDSTGRQIGRVDSERYCDGSGLRISPSRVLSNELIDVISP